MKIETVDLLREDNEQLKQLIEDLRTEHAEEVHQLEMEINELDREIDFLNNLLMEMEE